MTREQHERILELIQEAAKEAERTGTRVVLHYRDEGNSYEPDGYGGMNLREDRDVNIQVAAEPVRRKRGNTRPPPS